MPELSPCADCTRGCCRHYLVTVIGYDAWVIANGLTLAPEQFLVTVPRLSESSRGFYLDRTGNMYDIALDKQRTQDEEKPCVFWLAMPGGLGRCGIYSLRPYVCQTYPAFLGDNQAERRTDVLCPDDAWRDGVLKRPIWRERLLRMQIEFDIYGLAVARWNYHVLNTPHPETISVLGYYTYLMRFYSNLEPTRASLGDEEWNAMCEAWSASLRQGTTPIDTDLEVMQSWSTTIEAIRNIGTGFFPLDPQSQMVRMEELIQPTPTPP